MPKARSHADLLRFPLRDAGARSNARTGGVAKVAFRSAFALSVVILTLPVAVLPVAPWVRAALGVLLLAVAALRLRGARMAERAPSGWVAVDPTGVVRTDALGATRLVDWTARFGVTLLVTERRDRGLIAFTTAQATRYLRVRTSIDNVAIARQLFAGASIVSDTDVTLGARGEDDVAISAADAAQLVAVLRTRCKGAFERILLSDARGGAIAVDGNDLRIGDRLLDLEAPLEWRGFMFFESTGQVSTVMQGTWIRQGAIEVVLVAPMPTELSAPRRPMAGDIADERAVARDLRVTQALPEKPPPLDQRIAVERLFMIPLRRMLDRAPRPSRTVIEAAPLRDGSAEGGAGSIPRSAS